MNSTRLLRASALIALLLAGVVASVYGGRRLRAEAREGWLQRATREAERSTHTALFWLHLYHAQMRGFGAVFQASEEVTEDELLDALSVIEAGEAAMPLTSLAFVRVPEGAAGQIALSTDREGDLAPGSPLPSEPAVALTLAQALDRGGSVAMGPAFAASSGRTQVPLGLAAPNAGVDGVLLSLVDLGALVGGLEELHISRGLQLRLEEEHRWPGRGLERRFIAGGDRAPAEAVAGLSIVGRSGEAEWVFHWDILPQYQGGPPTGLAEVVQYGGLLATALVTAVVALLLRQNRQVNRRVEERTRELRQARDQAEAAARQSEQAQREVEAANQARSSFLSNISHEIRTPLNAILGFADILAASVKEPQQQRHARTIQESGKALLRLVNDILDVSRVDAGALELHESVVDVAALMEEVRRLFAAAAQRKGLELRIDVAAGVPPALLMDGPRLRQILLSLAGNAVKFTERGHVQLTLSAAAMEGSETADLTVTVRDTGIGIPEEEQERVFAAFTQRQGQSINEYGGTGMGLAVTRRLAERMGGGISLASQVGVGSIFTVSLPGVKVAPAGAGAAAAAAVDVERLRFAPATVLVADDVETNRELVKGFLVPLGLQVLEAGDGQQAIDLVRTRRPAVVLMDIKMPVLDGFTAARRLKAQAASRAVPIVAVTAPGIRESEAEIAAVCDGLVGSPVERDELVRALLPFLGPTTAGAPEVEVKAEINGAAPDDELTPAARARLPELAAALQGQAARWEELRVTQTINEVEEFARQMQALGEAHGHGALRRWGERLAAQASSFDMASLPETMEQFSGMLTQIQGLSGVDQASPQGAEQGASA